MTYNVLSRMLNPTHSLTHIVKIFHAVNESRVFNLNINILEKRKSYLMLLNSLHKFTLKTCSGKTRLC